MEITSDSIKIIKSLPNSENVFDWFPLEIGNKMVVLKLLEKLTIQVFPLQCYEFAGTKIMEILKDTLINGKSYFVVVNNLLNRLVFDEKLFLRS
ncbi:MAG: hypothetical protein MZV64_02570 [Ignavibacteriales bacterium]|nr:hypothetical protein [Ignavibacteriales bacterium]